MVTSAMIPSCPRCGYDQSGVIASWDASCPLRGVCSECGLGFDWPDVLREDRQRLRWFYEHAAPRSAGLPSAWITWAWAVRPWVFWRRVRLHHRLSIPRLWLWLLVLLVPLQAATAAMMNVAWWIYWEFSRRPWVSRPDNAFEVQVSEWTMPFGYITTKRGSSSVRTFEWTIDQWSLYAYPTLAIVISMPLLLACLPATRRKAKVRAGHLLRVGIYSLAWVVPIWLLNLVDIGIFLVKQVIGLRGNQQWIGAPYRYKFVLTSWLGAHEQYWFVTLAAFVVWLGAWWWFAIRDGLRLEGHAAVWWLLMLAAGLAAGISLVTNDAFIVRYFV